MAEVVTGEAVVLDVPVAGFAHRLAALLLDLLVQVSLIVIVLVIVLPRAGHLDGAALSAILLSGWILIIVGYPTIFETLTRGKTPGKMALGQRVVSDDGSPVRFRQALLRALMGVLEVWSFAAPAGLIASMLSARGKRLGDMLAGTFVIQERVPAVRQLPPEMAVIPPPLLAWAQVLELSRLSDQSAAEAGSFLRRLADLRPAARDELGRRLAAAVAAQVSPPPPPGTPPVAYLSAVLAVRRQREWARLTGQAGTFPGDAGGTAFPPGYGHPPGSMPGHPPAADGHADGGGEPAFGFTPPA